MRKSFTFKTSVAGVLTCATAVTLSAAAMASAATPGSSTPQAVRVVTVSPAPKPAPKVTLRTATVTITARRIVTARTTVKERIGGAVTWHKAPVRGHTVELQARVGRSARWVSINHARTGTRTGAVTFTVTQGGASEQYRLVLLAGGGYATANSAIVTVKR